MIFVSPFAHIGEFLCPNDKYIPTEEYMHSIVQSATGIICFTQIAVYSCCLWRKMVFNLIDIFFFVVRKITGLDGREGMG